MYLKTSVKPIFHDSDELSVTEVTIVILIKNLEYGFHNMRT